MRNIGLESKDTALISVLQIHFKVKLDLVRVRVKLICLFITAFCHVSRKFKSRKVKRINFK